MDQRPKTPKVIKNLNEKDIKYGQFYFVSDQTTQISQFYCLHNDGATEHRREGDRRKRSKKDKQDTHPGTRADGASPRRAVTIDSLSRNFQIPNNESGAKPKLVIWLLCNLKSPNDQGINATDTTGQSSKSEDKKDHGELKANKKSIRMWCRELITFIANTEAWLIAEGEDTEFFRYIGDAIRDHQLVSRCKDPIVFGLTTWPYIQTDLFKEVELQNTFSITKISHTRTTTKTRTCHNIVYEKPDGSKRKLSPNIRYYIFSENTDNSSALRPGLEKDILECVIVLNSASISSIHAQLEQQHNNTPVINILKFGEKYRIHLRKTNQIISSTSCEESEAEQKEATETGKCDICDNEYSSNNYSKNENRRCVLKLSSSSRIDQVILEALTTASSTSDKKQDLHRLLSLSFASDQFPIVRDNKKMWQEMFFKKYLWLGVEAVKYNQVKFIDDIIQSRTDFKKAFSEHQIGELYNRENTSSNTSKDLNVKLLERIGQYCDAKRLAMFMHVTDTEAAKFSTDKNKNAFQDVFIWSLIYNKLELSFLLWENVAHHIGAALFAYYVFKVKYKATDETGHKEILQNNMKDYSRRAVEIINLSYKKNKHKTLDLLTMRMKCWGEASCIEMAIDLENLEILNHPACRFLCKRCWYQGQSEKLVALKQMTETNESQDVIKQSTVTSVWMKYFFSPIIIFWFDFLGLILFLMLYALLLLTKLEMSKFHWIEWILWSWIITYTLEDIFSIFDNVSRVVKSRRKMAENSSTKKVHKSALIFMSFLRVIRKTRPFQRLEFAALLLFYIAWISRWAAYYQAREDSSAMNVAIVFFSLDYILFTLLLFKFFFSSRFLGPLLLMIIEMISTMGKFLLILLVIFIAFAIASESVLYPKTQINSLLVYHIFRKAYWILFGEFFLEEIEIRDMQSDQCTNDPEKYNHYASLRCPSYLGSYFVPILMGVYVMIANVLLFNLLIAKFNSTIEHIEKNAEVIWQLQRFQLTRDYSKKTILAPCFLPITLIILLTTKSRADIFKKRIPNERMTKELILLEQLVVDETSSQKEK
ncbi:transient receptor potential cation channel subfamily M member 1 [Biomphalaria glabrata]|nr:transient receptor potential cation channel subfamily M member 1-like [Biomphalaria glabrata]